MSHTIKLAKNSDPQLEKQFIDRIQQGKLSRQENPVSHFCCYFAAIDIVHRQVFLGHHKKSGLWLFNGAHLDIDESPVETVMREMVEEWGYRPVPSDRLSLDLLTISPVIGSVQPCKVHYDLWYFIPIDREEFTPDPSCLATEFHQAHWFTLKEARQLSLHPTISKALDYISLNLF